ncbi:MAG: hypothetical protein J3K34DRAFT_410251 [Monoraphidium minutum]|nr:MAG: hypothetical protein J3K34DRAFT_410251 [Monoraphidium minutum]
MSVRAACIEYLHPPSQRRRRAFENSRGRPRHRPRPRRPVGRGRALRLPSALLARRPMAQPGTKPSLHGGPREAQDPNPPPLRIEFGPPSIYVLLCLHQVFNRDHRTSLGGSGQSSPSQSLRTKPGPRQAGAAGSARLAAGIGGTSGAGALQRHVLGSLNRLAQFFAPRPPSWRSAAALAVACLPPPTG